MRPTPAPSLPVHATNDGARFLVRVTPRASRTAIAGIYGEGNQAALKIALSAPPVEGRANAALMEFLAELLNLPRSALSIASGEHGRSKTILIRGRSPADIAEAIRQALAAAQK